MKPLRKGMNILLFVMDDQRADTIRELGNPHISTPHLDKLVRSGTFIRPYTTVPVCTPARGELLSGCHALQNGCDWFGRKLHAELTLLPQALQQAGYHTCHVGKWHNDGHPIERGYQEVRRLFSDAVEKISTHYRTYIEHGQTVSGHYTELCTQSAADYIETRSTQDGPWFCYVAPHSPHDPRTAPEPWASMYDAMLPPLPDNFWPEHPFDNGDMLIRDEKLAGFPRKQAEIRRHLADYYAMISHHDHCIGEVLRKLDQTGQRDNTLIVFTSDHGLAIGSHGLMGKENLYEHSARVPLIISGPGVPEGQRIDDTLLCGHYDLMPTLLEWVGVHIPESCRGISYAEVLQGKKNTVRTEMFAAYRQCMVMVRNDRYKMIYYPNIDRTQLFDLHHDPMEYNDLMVEWRRDSDKGMIGTNNPPFDPFMTREEADQRIDELKNMMLNTFSNDLNLHPAMKAFHNT